LQQSRLGVLKKCKLMNFFKFNCPACGQRIEAEAFQIGQPAVCLVCHAAIVIPRPESSPAETVKAPPSAPPAAVAATPAPAPDPVPPPAPDSTGSETAAAASPPVAQIPVLTPEIKLEIVAVVREQLADESGWMPEVTGGSGYAYAGKMVDGKLVEVTATSPAATHFSLFGAMLREFDRRNVTPIAHGRREFLDQEIPDAIQQVRSNQDADAAGAAGPGTPLTHAETLLVLDALAKRYRAEIKAAKTAFSARKLPNIRMEDLVGKLELDVSVRAEEVATVLYHELEELKERLNTVEKALRKSKSPPEATKPS
jgi:hypothetical protein